MSNNINILLVGAGYMSREYIKVLRELPVSFSVSGRSKKNLEEVKQLFPGVHVTEGGLEAIPNTHDFTHAIIAVNVAQLYPVTLSVIEKGLKNILCEKPIGLKKEEIEQLHKLSVQENINLAAAYNRRFYASVDELVSRINNEGGVTSVHFEFTEWINKIDASRFTKEELNRWLISNSSHIIDLAFYLGGVPKSLHAQTSGEDKISWHPNASVFTGSGFTDKNIPFSYHSNWDSAGRWSVEVLTKENRYYLKPVEKLFVQKKNTIQLEEVPFDGSLDEKYKPGVFNLVTAFIKGEEDKRLCKINNLANEFPFFLNIGGYN